MNQLLEIRINENICYLSGTIFPMHKSSYQSAQMLTNSHLINQALLAESILRTAGKSVITGDEFDVNPDANLKHPWVKWVLKGRRNAMWLAYYGERATKLIKSRSYNTNKLAEFLQNYIREINEYGRLYNVCFNTQDKKTPFPRLVPQLSEQFGVKTTQVYARYYAETYILNNKNDVELDVHYKGREVPHLIKYYHDKAIEEGLRYNPEV